MVYLRKMGVKFGDGVGFGRNCRGVECLKSSSIDRDFHSMSDVVESTSELFIFINKQQCTEYMNIFYEIRCMQKMLEI